MNEQELIIKVKRIKELDRLLVKELCENKTGSFLKDLEEYKNLIKTIKTSQINKPIVQLPDKTDKSVTETLNKISLGKALPFEKAIVKDSDEAFIGTELSFDEINEVADESFHVWFSHYEYVGGLYEIGCLIVSAGKLPDLLGHYIGEAQKCFAFQQHTAVVALCRTILEVAIRDICIKEKIIDDPEKPKHHKVARRNIKQHIELSEMIKRLCKKTKYTILGKKLHEIKGHTNYLIHGQVWADSEKAKNMFKETLSVIHELYSKYEKYY